MMIKYNEETVRNLEELEIETLERHKLARELVLLDAPWFRKPGYLALAIPVTLALLSTVGTVAVNVIETASGLRTQEKAKAQLEKDNARHAVMADLLEREKELVDNENARLAQENLDQSLQFAEEREKNAADRKIIQLELKKIKKRVEEARLQAIEFEKQLIDERATPKIIIAAKENVARLEQEKSELDLEEIKAENETKEARRAAQAARKAVEAEKERVRALGASMFRGQYLEPIREWKKPP